MNKGAATTPPAVYETLEVFVDGPVGWLVFNRPSSGNAINSVMFEDLERAWAELDRDPSVRVIVNTGNGSAFQTGLDVIELARNKEALRKSSRQTRDFTLRMTGWHCGVGKPVIAAVNGTCAGGGLHFVADADIVVAADTATFLDPHVSVGQVSAYETIGLVAKARAEAILRMALLGRYERIGAHRARSLGILSEVVPAETLRAHAQQLAETIARHDPEVLRQVKAALWGALDKPVRP
ncbi:MAG: enoyl-CoA hydratase/isomerase family protein [Acidimicrobiia bacterium]